MTDDMTAMSHENDGGLCWCGPKCGPVAYEPLTPVEAVVCGVVLFAASDSRIRAMAEENDEQRFIEGCKAPWFEQLVGQGLIAVRDAADVGIRRTE